MAILDTWEAGDGYERYMGRWSRLVAREFLEWLDPGPHLHWLEVGCGTGVLAATALECCDPAGFIGVDSSPEFLAVAREAVSDPRFRFEHGQAQKLPLADASCDVVVSGLVLNFVPDPAEAVTEMRRVARSGAMIALYVWDYAEGMEFIRHFWDAALTLDPSAAEHDEGRRFPVCHPEPLAGLFTDAGLEDVVTRSIRVPTVFADFDDYWSPFSSGVGPAPGYYLSLDEETRTRLREVVRATLPTAPDGTIPISARAWAVRGTAP